jgi:nitroreductase
MDLKTADELLTTTRSVRKRLDFTQPVDLAVVERCIAIALQAPTGSNQQGWHFLVVTDPAKRKAIGDLYDKGFQLYANAPESIRPSIPKDDPRFAQTERIIDSAAYLASRLHEAPVMVIPCIEGRVENAGVLAQASVYGSILPAAWSFMLALRARGLGTAWTTLHLLFEQDAAKILGIPDTITQTALFPVAHYNGRDFKPAKRLPPEGRTHWNEWGRRRP